MSQELDINELVRMLKDAKDNYSTQKFCFLIGAGASIASGIPSAHDLAKQWLEDLEKLPPQDFYQWLDDNKIDKDKPSLHYSTIAQKRFCNTSINPVLQELMENATPSIGYVLFADLISQDCFNRVITTNFDFLIEDALLHFTDARPLVCGHESLAQYANMNAKRPIILKVHNDLFYDPKNSKDDLEKLGKDWIALLNEILKQHKLIVIGYSGHDDTLTKWIKGIETNKRESIYWCYRDTLPEDILDKKDYTIKIQGFEELMYKLSVNSVIDTSVIDKDKIIKNAKDKITRLQKEMDELLNKESKNTTETDSSSSFLASIDGETNW